MLGWIDKSSRQIRGQMPVYLLHLRDLAIPR